MNNYFFEFSKLIANFFKFSDHFERFVFILGEVLIERKVAMPMLITNTLVISMREV